jgi:hypothetical protein
MRIGSKNTRRLAIVLSASIFSACTLGAKEMNRLGLGDPAGAGGSSGTSSSVGSGGMSSTGSGASSGASGHGSGDDGGASIEDAGGDDAASSQDTADDGGTAGAASGGTGGMSGSGGSGRMSSGGSGGSGGGTSGLADCTHDAAQSHDGHDYYFCSNYMSWPVARDICADGGGSLVVIDDAGENDFLLAHFGPHPSWWIGANDETTPDEWHWVDGSNNDGPDLCAGNHLCSPVGARYVNFAIGEPNAVSTESCGAIQSAGTWADEYCVVSKPFICEV